MAILFADNFVEPSGTPDLTIHTPDTGTGWTSVSGSAIVSSANDCAWITSAGTFYYSDDLGDPDAYVKFYNNVRSSSNTDQIVGTRIADIDNYIGAGGNTTTTVKLVNTVAGVQNLLQSVSWVGGDVIEIRPSGTTIEWYKNDALISSHTVTEHATATKQGFISTTGDSSSSWVNYYETGTAGAPATTSVTTGTSVPTQTEADVVAGGNTIILTLSNDTWVAAGAAFDAQRQAIIDGLDSAQSELTGWNAEVRDKEVVTSVVRTSNTVCTITLSASAAYDITATETITPTIPAAALVTSVIDVVSSPTFTVTHTVTVPTITTSSIKNNTTQIAINESNIIINVYDDNTGDLVVRKTGLTSDTNGFVTFSDALMAAATQYKIVIERSNGGIGIERQTTS